MDRNTKPGNNIRRLMNAKLVNGKPVSANAVAKETGVPQSTITRILNGDVQDPRAKQLEKLAAYFGVTLSELRDGASPAKAPAQAPTMQTFSAGDDPLVLAYVTGHEMELLTLYRSSNDSDKALIAKIAKAISQQSPTATPTT